MSVLPEIQAKIYKVLTTSRPTKHVILIQATLQVASKRLRTRLPNLALPSERTGEVGRKFYLIALTVNVLTALRNSATTTQRTINYQETIRLRWRYMALHGARTKFAYVDSKVRK